MLKEYVPSQYQVDIFNFVEHGLGNAVIEAVPGAGKTYTLIQCLKHIPTNAKVLVAAFNTDIVNELKSKIAELDVKPNIECRTIHSLGLSILRSNHREVSDEVMDYKYTNYISEYLSSYDDEGYKRLSKKEKKTFAETIKKFIDFGRYYLCRTVNDLQKIGDQYAFKCIGSEKEIALELMERGKQDLSKIDFTDMVWLPIVLHCKPYNHLYDWILVDEAQDLEKEERALVELCTKNSTRRMFLGERNQSINSFKGADSESFNELKQIPNTQCLPLSITYRCSKAVVRFLNRFNPEIKAAPHAVEGSVKWRCDLSDVQEGDMVLCRVNAPLMEIYAKLSDLGIPAYIKGKDVGNNLIALIAESHEEKLNRGLREKGVFSYLYNKLFDMVDDVMKKNNITFELAIEDLNVCQLYDKILALECITGDLATAEELTVKLRGLFSDEKKNGVSLSTVHKAKGLEAENVYICCPSLLPSKSAKLPWELEEERHLEYVAYSRPKKKLGFLSEDGMRRYSQTGQQKASELQTAKLRVFTLYGDELRCSGVTINEETAHIIVENATEVKPFLNNVVTMDSVKAKPIMVGFKRPTVKKR